MGGKIDEENLEMLTNIMKGVSEKDPVVGTWAVSLDEEAKGICWCDASSITL